MTKKITQKITPFLWFNDNAEEAANFYTSVFPGSRIVSTAHYGEAGPGPKGSVMTVRFELAGESFVALNGGPLFKFTEAISFVVNCETQDEIENYWEKLSAGGETSRCGWGIDKFALSWQVVPAALEEMVSEDDPARSDRVMQALLRMAKLELAGLQAAYNGR